MLGLLWSDGFKQRYDVFGSAILRLADILVSKCLEDALFHFRGSHVGLHERVELGYENGSCYFAMQKMK